MTTYLKDVLPISELEDNRRILERIAYRYMKENQPCAFYMRPWIQAGFMQEPDGMYNIDFGKKYPKAKNGAVAYACAYIYAEKDKEITVSADVMCGGEIWINSQRIIKTTVELESAHKKHNIPVTLHRGKNRVFIKARKTALGFGVKFGEGCIAWEPIYMYMPFAEYAGYMGFAYTGVYKTDIYPGPETFPDIHAVRPDGFFAPPLKDGKCFRKDGYIYSCAYFTAENGVAEFSGHITEDTQIYVDQEVLGRTCGKINLDMPVKAGRHYIVLKTCHNRNMEFDFSIYLRVNGVDKQFEAAELVLSDTPWLCLGALQKEYDELLAGIDFTCVYEENEFWRAGISENYLRKLRRNDLYGKWTYPLGVLLYGLLAAGKYLGDHDITEYAVTHLRCITENQQWAELDAQRNGVPSINRQPVCMGMLDYCGSCGNALLEAYDLVDGKYGFAHIAERVAQYIKSGQERLEDGTFYRERPHSIIDYKTVWADDLYMSVPFLCRYYQRSGDNSYLDDAANQIIRFKNLLYMPERKLMSHVYNLVHQKKTEVPWGRGNGWTLFAITELLEVMENTHTYYAEIMEFYLDYCEGIRRRQDKDGMWHQVLDDEGSYSETSCTAMFIYSFARGVCRGRLDQRYKTAAYKGMQALYGGCIDTDGNVYGVCCGSAYSYRPEYYKYELPWILNDTHGTGIVLLAGVETEKMMKGEDEIE